MIKTTLDNSDLDVYYSLKENQLFHFNEPNPGIFIAESPYVVKRALNAGYEPISFLIEREQLSEEIEKLVQNYNVPAYVCDYAELKNLVGYHMSRGLLCAMKRKPNPRVESICEGKKRIAVLENIMNPTNTGAIIRSAVALGVEAVVLTKGCSDPLQRRASRVSMGNVFSVPWAYMDTNLTDVDLLKKQGFIVVSMALPDRAIFINEIKLSKDYPVAVVLGTEGEGLDEKTLEKSDIIAKIPMFNGVDSLNVAAASAVAFWEIFKEK